MCVSICVDGGGGVEGIEGGEGEEGDGTAGGGGSSSSAGAKAHRARRRSSARSRLANKPMDWQVCIYTNSLHFCNLLTHTFYLYRCVYMC